MSYCINDIVRLYKMSNSPKTLKEKLVFNKDIDKGYTLRNENQIKQVIKLKNHYGESTFIYLFSKLINNFILNDLELKFSFFVNRMINNVNKHSHDFLKIFPKLDLRYNGLYFELKKPIKNYSRIIFNFINKIYYF